MTGILEELESRSRNKSENIGTLGKIRHHIILFLNEKIFDTREGLDTPVNEDDTLTILPSIAGR